MNEDVSKGKNCIVLGIESLGKSGFGIRNMSMHLMKSIQAGKHSETTCA